MSQHIEISVKTAPQEAEDVSYILMEKLGCSGTVIEENCVKGYIPYTETPDYSKLAGYETSTKIIKDEEWAENWKKYWHPMKIGEKIVICPSWEEYCKQEGEIIITLDPGSAFGTGTHPTTRLCVNALEKEIPKLNGEISIADVGTGSGILAITAAKLGAAKLTGVDNDASVISVACENAQINAVDAKCEFFAGSAADITGKYDIVVANILAEVIIDIAQDLKNLLKEDGVMILSGIIERKRPDVEEALAKISLKTRQVLDETGWVAIIAEFIPFKNV